MAEAANRITRITQTVATVTSRFFRCHGLHPVSPSADRLGLHDLAFWLIFLALLSGWAFFLHFPQTERLKLLDGREQILKATMDSERRELARLKKGIADLTKGEKLAWERVARGRMGWVAPGEVTDGKSLAGPERAVRAPSRPTQPDRPTNTRAPLMLPSPRIPTLPQPPAAIRATRVARSEPKPIPQTDLIGPSIGTPPPPLKVATPAIPRPQLAPGAANQTQRVARRTERASPNPRPNR